MSRPIKELPTLTGEAAANFLKRADAAERRYKERKEAGTLRDITKDPGYISMKKILKNGSVQKNVGSHSGSFQTVIPFLP